MYTREFPAFRSAVDSSARFRTQKIMSLKYMPDLLKRMWMIGRVKQSLKHGVAFCEKMGHVITKKPHPASGPGNRGVEESARYE